MPKRVLITGGAGFIGSHVADLLLASGYAVRILDLFVPQVHGKGGTARHVRKESELLVGDICDGSTVETALHKVDAVIHLAAAVGVGQSMYEIVSYTRTNDLGTAVLLEALARHPVERLVCASSMSVYGEGLAQRSNGEIVAPDERPGAQLRRGAWEVTDQTGEPLQPLPTPEDKPLSLSSVYALNKYNQERLCLLVGRAYRIPTVALRLFNVYGPRQSLSNPYTGVLAIFASRLLNKRPPLVFEDGNQRRDFVHVYDVARACVLALTAKTAGHVFNIGSGESRTILSVASDLARVIGEPHLAPHITGKYRAGDIRHCFADLSRSRAQLGYSPGVDFQTGLQELAEWLADEIAEDSVEAAMLELDKRGLVA
ncbi:MAG TPA: NAD-dependent epimerase/dehydratase family protein [Xanthobacteraceae bacterium]|jgi:dTDP-L-rhamnose 4-epimerase